MNCHRSQPDSIPSLDLTARCCAIVLVTVGLIALFDRVVPIAFVERAVPVIVPMKDKSAACFVLAGLAILLRRRKGWIVCAGLLSVIALVSLVRSLLGLDTEVDLLLLGSDEDRQVQQLGRMSPITGFCFCLASAALLLRDVGGRRTRALQEVMTIAIGAIGLLALMGHLYGVRLFYQVANFPSVALLTAAMFILMAAGLISANRQSLALLLTSDTPGGQLARRLLPAVVFVPVVVGWLDIEGELSGWCSTSFGTAAVAVTSIFIFGGLVWTTCRHLDRAEVTRLAMEDDLRKQAALIDLTPDAIIGRRRSGTITYWSRGAQSLYGWTKEEAVGSLTNDLLQTEFPEPLEQILNRIERSGRWSGELVHRTKDGRRVVVQSRWLAHLDIVGNEMAEVLESNVDITERKRAETMVRHTAEELARSNHDLEQFAYVASHDLQEPLRMVTGFVQLLQQKNEGRLDAESDQFIAFVVDGAKRMQTLINDLLTYSRVGRGGVPAAVAASDAVRQAMANLQATIQQTGAEIVYHELPIVRADRTHLAQLFQNLLGNALKFRSEAPPRIEINVTRQGPQWLFSVRDNGIGLDPSYQDRIFLIFQRLHSRQQYSGTGIGLAICKKIVERLGGRIWVESQPGQGATFFFLLPAEDSP